MAISLTPRAALAQESVRALERALSASRTQWGDAARQEFDQRHAEVIVASGRNVARELSDLAQQLAAALASLGSTT